MRITKPDLHRELHCLLGLPFDALTLEQSVEHIRQAAFSGAPCFFSTPNLNFLISARSNEPFRQSVIRSDLSLADGMPVVWLAKLLSIPLAERVAGSDVFDALRKHGGRRIKVFFFGGQPGVAERAMKVLNAEAGGLECVGYESPGFGSITEMSAPQTLAKINASGAEFLVVSLGAIKGQAWIEHNLNALQVPVVSHLGAVVNFVSGNVQRAPRWMQKMGMEWLWRVVEEPSLWRRYWKDFRGLLGVALISVPRFYFVNALFVLTPRSNLTVSSAESVGPDVSLILSGAARHSNLSILRCALDGALESGQDLLLDLRDVNVVDSAFAGLLLVAGAAWQQRNKRLRLHQVSWKVRLYLATIGLGNELFTAENPN